MIETHINKLNSSAVIVLRPNNSSNWRFNMIITATLAFILFVISTYFALHGLWLIFAFAGLSVITLIVCQYIRLRANQSIETITFDKFDVVVERRCYQKAKSWKYHRIWAKFLVKPPDFRGYPKKICLRSHGKDLEIGAFLNKKDKEHLIKDLNILVNT